MIPGQRLFEVVARHALDFALRTEEHGYQLMQIFRLHAEHALKDGDRIEIVHALGGG